MVRLPILMYHNVTENPKHSFGLTISTENLERQLQYLQRKKYKTFHFSELNSGSILPPKSVIITFDDITQCQLYYAVPLLKKYGFKATFFIPFAYVGQTDLWNSGTEKIMSLEELKSLENNIELGYHSFHHKRYADLNYAQIQEDFNLCQQFIEQSNLKVYKALAYPYGNYPKKGKQKQEFEEILKIYGIQYSLKIGNRVNRFPFKDKQAIKRIDIKGTDALFVFKLKLRIGKLKLF